MKIISNKQYEYLQKCKEFYEKYVEHYKMVGKTKNAALARKRYWAKNKERFGELRAQQYRETHPDAKKYKPRKKIVKRS
jgi:hypothetical protein